MPVCCAGAPFLVIGDTRTVVLLLILPWLFSCLSRYCDGLERSSRRLRLGRLWRWGAIMVFRFRQPGVEPS
jgi:hypothetical protein